MSDKSGEGGAIGKALAKVSLPESSERFVQKVMIGVRESERMKTRWLDWWRIPALGIGLASVVFFGLVAVQSSTETIDTALLAGFEDPALLRWASDADGLAPDDVLQFALEESGGSL